MKRLSPNLDHALMVGAWNEHSTAINTAVRDALHSTQDHAYSLGIAAGEVERERLAEANAELRADCLALREAIEDLLRKCESGLLGMPARPLAAYIRWSGSRDVCAEEVAA